MQNSPQQTRSVEHKSSSKESPLVIVSQIINAPVTAVFHAWKDTDIVKQWWGPEGYYCTKAQIDFHVGEKYLLNIQNDDGDEYWSTGVYVEIDPYRCIVFSNFPANSAGDLASDMEISNGPFSDIRTAFVTVEFEDMDENTTRISLCHEGVPPELYNESYDRWVSSLNKLKKVVEQQH